MLTSRARGGPPRSRALSQRRPQEAALTLHACRHCGTRLGRGASGVPSVVLANGTLGLRRSQISHRLTELPEGGGTAVVDVAAESKVRSFRRCAPTPHAAAAAAAVFVQ